MASENKHKHLDYIQSAITRMASNSFYLKGWTVTLIVALVALSSKDHIQAICFFSSIFTIVFWYLDAYYLKQERLFRRLYHEVSQKDEENIDFSMDTSKFKKDEYILCIMFCNQSITIFYFVILCILFVRGIY